MKNNKKIKKKLLISSVLGLMSLPISFSVGLLSTKKIVKDENHQKYLSSIESSNDNNQYPIYPSQSNGQNSFLSTKMGPIIYSNNTLTALNWFGGKRWDIDMEIITGLKSGEYGGASWKRSWYNWDYDQNRDILWVLSYGYSKGNSKFLQQKLYSFNGITGKKIGEFNLVGEKTEFKFVTALVSGNVLIYGGASLEKYDAVVQLYNVKTGKIELIDGNSEEGLNLPPKYSN